MELSVKFASQICHENAIKLLDGTYLADFGIDIILSLPLMFLLEQSFHNHKIKPELNTRNNFDQRGSIKLLDAMLDGEIKYGEDYDSGR